MPTRRGPTQKEHPHPLLVGRASSLRERQWQQHEKTNRKIMADDLTMNPTREDFAALLDESMGAGEFAEGTVVKGRVAAVDKDYAVIDVGLKTEGRIPVKEFGVDE